ncbi:uncharacterized protein LOC110107644 [Dendrobium catenatum]|uniref:Uncharacterized protein n=1 Tax=Dendrobium catenatum TaxID=906689 RepID=A0A2I0WNG9_9ASPA|nr:uncharacterized protein LOC110107644 [Dendrobium catenatum]XP_028551759.1 uncharacterized protein LOC110107644 [Dendrobium catenatum]PKU77220.1 hypothetical protein MA16_Dca013256 [Dendrobium catenatum]
MARSGALAASAASMAFTSGHSWRIIPRPVLETILNNFANHLRVPQPLLLHGPRGVGKTSLLIHRLLPEWNKGPHITGYVDFAANTSVPWTSSPPGDLPSFTSRLEHELEAMAERGVRLGTIGSASVFSALNKWHGVGGALRRLIGPGRLTKRDEAVPVSALWNKALIAFMARIGDGEIDVLLGEAASREEAAFMREAVVALRLAKEVLGMHQEWRREAVMHLNRTGRFSRSLVNSATDWPCLLLQILSDAAEIDFFQPKLVINNIDVLRRTVITDDSAVPAAMYHDSLIWRVVEMGVNDKCLPVIFITSDSYYSYQAFIDFGFRDMFIFRETFGWTHEQAKLHMTSDFFSESEWKVIDEVLGPNPRHLSELYALKQTDSYQHPNSQSNFEDIVDVYLAYLQVTVVNPAMESALALLQKFSSDVRNGKILKEQLHFGAPWRHPPPTDDPVASLKWAKIQLMDFVQSLVNTEFGVNYLADKSFEILDDPALVAMLEVGLLYQQRDPSFIRPITVGIQRCIVRWLVQERMQMSFPDYMSFLWQRIIRGRSYRHLMKEIGYK